MPRQKKDHQQTVDVLMQFWELPYVVHFIRVFKKLLKIKKNFTTESLAKELATDRLKHEFEEEIVKLVAFVSSEEDCDVHNWESIAEELLEKSGIKFDALKDSTFTELKPEERLRLIKNLVDLVRIEKQDELISFQAKNRKSKNLKFQPVGKDKEGNRYWYFDDKKLYRETCKGGITNLNAVCCTLHEWESLISGMKKSSSKVDREFSKFLKESVFPKVKPQLGEAEAAERESADRSIPLKRMKSDIKEKTFKDTSPGDDSQFGVVSPTSFNSDKNVVKRKKKPKLDGSLNDAMNQPKLQKFKKIKHRDKNILIRKASSPDALGLSPPFHKSSSPPRSPSQTSSPSSVPSPRRFSSSEHSNSSVNDSPAQLPREDFSEDEDEFGERSSPSPRRPPFPDDDPGIDLSIFEPRGKRKCVLEQEERRGKNKDWWEGQDEMGNSSDENRVDEDEVSDVSDNGPVKKKRRKKSKPIKSLDRKEHELDMMQNNKLYVFSTALANKAAHMVQQGRFKSIIEFHRSQSWDTPYLQYQVHCRPFKPTPVKTENAVAIKPAKVQQPKEVKTSLPKEPKTGKEKKAKDRCRLTSPKALISDDRKVDFVSKFKKVLSQSKEQNKKEIPSTSPTKGAPRVPNHIANTEKTSAKSPTKSEPRTKTETSTSKPVEATATDAKEKFEVEGSLKIHGTSLDSLKKSLAEKVGTNFIKRSESGSSDPRSKMGGTQESEPNPPATESEDKEKNNHDLKTEAKLETNDEAADAIDNLRLHEGMPGDEDIPDLRPSPEKGVVASHGCGSTITPSTDSPRDEHNTVAYGNSLTPNSLSYPAEIRKRPLYPAPENPRASPYSQLREKGPGPDVRTPPVKMQAKESAFQDKTNGERTDRGYEAENIQSKEDDSKSRESPRLQEEKPGFLDLTKSKRPGNLDYFPPGNRNSPRAFTAGKEREWHDLSKEGHRLNSLMPTEREHSIIQARLGHAGHVAPFSPQSVLQRSVPELRSISEPSSRSPKSVEIAALQDKITKPEVTRPDIPGAIAQSVLIPSSRASMNDEGGAMRGDSATKDIRMSYPSALEGRKEKRLDHEGRKSGPSSTCKIDLTKSDASDEESSRSYGKKGMPPERPSLFPCAQSGPGMPDKPPHYFVPGHGQRSTLPPSINDLASPGAKVLDPTMAQLMARGGRGPKESPLFIGHQKPMPGLSSGHPGRHSEKDIVEKVGSPLLRHDPFSSPFQAQKDSAEVFSGSRGICTTKAGVVPHGMGSFPIKDGESPLKYMKRSGSPHLAHDPLASLFQNHRVSGSTGRPSSPASSRSSVSLHQQALSRRENPGFHPGLPGSMSPPLQHGHMPGPFYGSRESLLCQSGKSSCRSPMTGSSFFGREGSSNPNSSLSRSSAAPSELEASNSSLSRDATRTMSRSPPGVHSHFPGPFMHRETVLNTGQLFARPPNLSHQTLKSPVDVGQPGRKSFSVESLTGSSERSEHGSMPYANGQSPTGLPFHPRLQGHGSHLGPHGHGFLSSYGGLLHGPNVGERYPYPAMHTAFSARTSFHPYIRSLSDYTNR